MNDTEASSSALNDLRKVVKREFTLRNVMLDVNSSTYLAKFLQNKSRDEIRKFASKLTDVFMLENVDDKLITLEVLKTSLVHLTRGKTSSTDAVFEVVSVDQWRRFVYDQAQKQFREADRQKGDSVFACDALRDRFELIKSLVSSMSIVPIELLYSRTGEDVAVLGMLHREKADTYTIEDPTGSLRVKILPSTVFEDGIYFEGGIFEFHGTYSSNVLRIQRIRLPALRPTVSNVAQSPVGMWSTNDRIIVLSDLFVDSPAVLQAFYRILDGFSACPPYAFILCGSFCTNYTATGFTESLKDGFRHLANIFAEFKSQYEKTQIVFVPSAEDMPKSTIYPRTQISPILAKYFKEFPNVHFASNPCKIKARDQTIVVFRDDVVEKMCRNACWVPKEVGVIPHAFCTAIASQRHICPMPMHVAPVIPQFDHTLHLNPVPDVLLIADKYKLFTDDKSLPGCLIVNPGSFARSSFDFLVYYPLSKSVEVSSCA